MSLRIPESVRQKLAKYFNDAAGFAREFLDFDPHPGQEKWLQLSDNVENALVAGNRWGKSQIAAVKRIHRCVYRKGWTQRIAAEMAHKHELYQSLNTSFTAAQASFVWNKVYALLQNRKARWLIKGEPKMTPFPTIEFITGARFQARSTARDGMYLLGADYDDINWDEAALTAKFLQIRDNVLRMRLVDRSGRMDYTSTGQGLNEFGQYFLTGLAGEKKDPLLYSQSGSSFENPHVNHEMLRINMARLPERLRRQNVLGEIVESGGTYFDGLDIDACTNTDLDLRVHDYDENDREAHASVFENKKPWVEVFQGHQYIHGWDLADKSDWTVGTTWDISVRPKRLVEFERFHKQGWAHVYDRIRLRHRKYKNSDTWLDSTGLGDVVLEELGDIGAHGVKFTGQSKDELLVNVQALLSLREIEFPGIVQFLEELRFYQLLDAGLKTDCVMSLAVAAASPEMRHTADMFYFSEVG